MALVGRPRICSAASPSWVKHEMAQLSVSEMSAFDWPRHYSTAPEAAQLGMGSVLSPPWALPSTPLLPGHSSSLQCPR